MTVTLELEEEQVNNLLNVLDKNKRAVHATDAVRWTDSAATEIAAIHGDIADQL